MDEGSKKVSFGFSKSNKLVKLVRPPKIEKPKIELVDSFDGKKGKFSYQGVVREEVKKEPLVIPLIGTRSAYDVIKAKLEESGKLGDGEEKGNGEEAPTIKKEKEEDPTPGNQSEDVKPSLESLAAKEILASLNQNGKNKEGTDSGRVIVPDMEKPTFVGEKESTMEDYENVPVDDYGLALLRGMGWTPQTGIGKESKIVAPVTTKLRPKRLGLGAEGSLLPPGEQPPIKRGVFVQIMVGEHKGSVGVVEGTDGDTGSVVVKVADAGNISLSENFVKVITKKEYEQFLNGNGHVADLPKEKYYGINEKDSQKNASVRIKKEEPNNDKEEKRHREKKARSISKSPEKKKRSRSRDRREDGRDKRQEKRSKRDRSRSGSRRRERSGERKRRKSVSAERRDKNRRSSESDDENKVKTWYRSSSGVKERRERSLERQRAERRDKKRRSSESDDENKVKTWYRSSSGVKERRERSLERQRRRSSESENGERRFETRKEHSPSPRRKKRNDSEDSDKAGEKKKRHRSRSGDRKEKKKRSSSEEKYSKKKSRRKDHSDEEKVSKKDKKKKKKSKKSRRKSESSD